MSYAHPEVLVSTEWVQEHLNDPKVRIVEVDYDPTANYQLGHIPGAVNIAWSQAVHEDRTCNPYEEIKKLYEAKDVTGDKDIETYCHIEERSSFSCFAHKD